MKIGIIGAFDEEIEKFIEMFDLIEEDNKNIYLGNYNNKELVIAKSGIGKVNSGSMTQYIIDKYEVDYIINSGCAGSLTEDVKVMDVVISSYVTYHDFKPERIMNYSLPDNGHVLADEKLIEITKNCLDKFDSIKYYVGPICSGDSFVTNSEQRDEIRNSTNALAVDMESGSIGHISRKNDVPFICIRTISDFADGVEDREKEAAYKSSNLVKKIIDNL